MKKSQWHLGPDEIDTASTKANKKQVPPAIDSLMRAKAARFIFDVAVDLSLPQITISTACVFMHRFYLRQPFHAYNHYDCGAATLFLACKVEETLCPVHEFIQQLARVASKKPSLTVQTGSKEYRRWMDRVLMMEQVVLETICFDLYVFHPYAHIKPLVDKLTQSEDIIKSSIDPFILMRLCWLWINDSMRTTCCLQFEPRQLATALLIIAGEELGLKQTDRWISVLWASGDQAQDSANQMTEQKIISQVRSLLNQIYGMPEIRHTLEARYATKMFLKNISADSSIQQHQPVALQKDIVGKQHRSDGEVGGGDTHTQRPVKRTRSD